MGVEVLSAVATAVEGAIDGYYFDKKVDKLSEAIEKVMASAHVKAKSMMADGHARLAVQQIELFSDINRSLDAIKNTYEVEMNLTVDKVDKKAQALLANVDKMVHGATRDLLGPEMQRLAFEAKAMINSLPIIDTRPKLTAFFPTFVTSSKKDVLIRCIGNFPVLSNSEDRPTLLFNQKEYPSIHNQPEIAFSIPLQDLFPPQEHASPGIRTASFDVRVPYEEKGLLSAFLPTNAFYHFQGSIYLLPESPGKFTIHYSKMKEAEETDTIMTAARIQNSREIAGGGVGHSLIEEPHTLKTKPGWKIVPDTVQFHVIESKGRKEKAEARKNRWERHEVTPEQATYLVTTHHYKPIKHCGKIIFQISATVARTIWKEERTIEVHSLKWGETRVIDTSKGSWVIHFDSFDGLHNEISGYGSSRFFRVEPSGEKMRIVIDPPEQFSPNFL